MNKLPLLASVPQVGTERGKTLIEVSGSALTRRVRFSKADTTCAATPKSTTVCKNNLQIRSHITTFVRLKPNKNRTMKKSSILILLSAITFTFSSCFVDETNYSSITGTKWSCASTDTSLEFTTESTGILTVTEYDSASESNRTRQTIFTYLYSEPTIALIIGGRPYDSGTFSDNFLYLSEHAEFFEKQ